jgi:uncharacterized protein (DUF2235 family)
VYGADAAARFKRVYGREVRPHFLGLWDTVTSLGWVYRRTYYPYSTWNPDVHTVRHAVAIDERRAQYRQNLWRQAREQDVRQVWFTGVHSDVGGGYCEQESGLAKIPLSWMVTEAATAGLQVDPASYQDVVLGEGSGASSGPVRRPNCTSRCGGSGGCSSICRGEACGRTHRSASRWRGRVAFLTDP